MSLTGFFPSARALRNSLTAPAAGQLEFSLLPFVPLQRLK